MHIVDGALSLPVLAVGTAVGFAGVGYGLTKVDYDRVPRVAVMSAAFFVSSLIHFPIGPSSIHLCLTGLMGLTLGWAVFPALLVGLFLQAIMFGHGGLTVLGVNVTNMALPAVACHYLFGIAVKCWRTDAAAQAGFFAGALAIGLAWTLTSLCLWFTGKEFLGLILIGWIPNSILMLIEGVLTASAVAFLRNVRPEVLDASPENRAHGQI